MTVDVKEKQVKAVLSLPGNGRYKHFIKMVVDCEELWGIYDSGWGLAKDEAGNIIFPVWPHEKYAEVCLFGEWISYKPKKIDLDIFVQEIIPSLREDKVLIGVFYTPEDKGVVPSYSQIIQDIIDEQKEYE